MRESRVRPPRPSGTTSHFTHEIDSMSKKNRPGRGVKRKVPGYFLRADILRHKERGSEPQKNPNSGPSFALHVTREHGDVRDS